MRFPEAEHTTIDLLRHGEPVGGRMLRGSTDHPLSVVVHLFVCNGLLRQVIKQPLSRVLAMDLPYAAMSRVRHERHALGETSFVEWIGR